MPDISEAASSYSRTQDEFAFQLRTEAPHWIDPSSAGISLEGYIDYAKNTQGTVAFYSAGIVFRASDLAVNGLETFRNLDLDIVKSNESFGGGGLCIKTIIISQKLYQAIKANHLDKSIEFEPIALAD